METTKDIWENINFSDYRKESAYELLMAQSNALERKSNGSLVMQIDTIIADILDDEKLRPAKSYILSVIVHRLGNYRRKILTVVEYIDAGPFPVDIYPHIDKIAPFKQVQKSDFIDKVQEILSQPLIINIIEDLFWMSRGIY